MAENQSTEHDDRQRSRQPDIDAARHVGELEGSLAPEAQSLYSGALLGDARLNGRGNQPVKIATTQRMQRTYGNWAVQRVLQRSQHSAATPHSPLPSLPVASVQRLGFDMEDLTRLASLSGSEPETTAPSGGQSSEGDSDTGRVGENSVLGPTPRHQQTGPPGGKVVPSSISTLNMAVASPQDGPAPGDPDKDEQEEQLSPQETDEWA